MRCRLSLALASSLVFAACGGGDTPDGVDAAAPDDAELGPDVDTTDAPPSIETNCNDGLDDDGDGQTDCLDSDCATDPECIPETMCADGIDNEGDGEADCLDDDCDGVAGCELGAEATCDDVFDNDGDGLTDCEDMDCDGVSGCRFTGEMTCDDGLDNDADGDTDCVDTDCNGVAGCEVGTELTCDDAFDNDADGDTDCVDIDCNGVAGCEFGTETTCDDALDNDADGAADCADPDCNAIAGCEFGAEATCDDGLDNDGDGATDCADSECSGIGFCEAGTELTCADGNDNDGDGNADCADSDCDPWCLAGCTAGETLVSVSSTDLPQAFGAAPVSVTSSVTVPNDGVVTGVAVTINITHLYVADADSRLISTTGTVIDLSTLNGGSGDNYTNTTFADSAATPITAGAPPFTGAFQPEEALAALYGEPTDGAWQLQVTDNFPGADDGTLDSFTLYLCVCSGIAGCEFGAACGDGVSNDDDTLADCADPDCASFGFCEPGAELSCTDGNDNDGDGQTDCADSDCGANPACSFEADCNDGIDNDGDTFTDCLDPACDGIDGCEFGAEITCGDGLDNDGDGSVDCLDAGCAVGALCSIPLACPAGAIKYGFTAGDTPVFIPDQVAVSSTINVPDTGVLLDAAIRLNITHTWVSDMDITLAPPAPAPTRDLSTDNGGSGDNYVNTILTDAAATSITSGTAPFTGSFRPEQPFSGLAGSAITGNWTLNIYDQFLTDTGNLTEYSLVLCACDPTGGECEFGAQCGDGVDNDGDAIVDCFDSNCASDPRCIPEPVCDDAIDNDLDGLTDCDDPDCGGISNCEFGTEVSCLDGFDNDSDGFADCSDTDCASNPTCAIPETDCSNGLDDDFDTLVDCADPNCAGISGCESEPNDTSVTANVFSTIAAGGRVRGRIGVAGESDYFQIVVPPGANQALLVTTYGGLSGNDILCTANDTQVNFYASDGTSELLIGSKEIGYAPATAHLVGSPPGPAATYLCDHFGYDAAPGTYYVRVRAQSATALIDYQLEVRAETLPVAVAEVEPNEDGTPSTNAVFNAALPGNDFSTATPGGPYSVDSVVTAALTPAGDEDLYSITNTGATDQLMIFETWGAGAFGACTFSEDTQLRVRNAAGDILAMDDDGAFNGYCSFLPYLLTAGTTVYLEVIDYDDDSTLAGYQLLISAP